jgi:hypothetical protein
LVNYCSPQGHCNLLYTVPARMSASSLAKLLPCRLSLVRQNSYKTHYYLQSFPKWAISTSSCLDICFIRNTAFVEVLQPELCLWTVDCSGSGGSGVVVTRTIGTSFIKTTSDWWGCCKTQGPCMSGNSEPAHVTTSIQRPPLFKDHLVLSQKCLYHAFQTLLRDHLIERPLFLGPAVVYKDP